MFPVEFVVRSVSAEFGRYSMVSVSLSLACLVFLKEKTRRCSSHVYCIAHVENITNGYDSDSSDLPYLLVLMMM